MSEKIKIPENLRFQCQGSGNCCSSRGEYGYVYLTDDDRKKMAKHLKMTVTAFTKKHCDRSSGILHLKEIPGEPDCMFLDGKRCEVYEARPVQCRTWPFWPEVMSPKVWKKEVKEFCPGVGKGPAWDTKVIRKILDEQIESEEALVNERKL